jgi:hypothetical protein
MKIRCLFLAGMLAAGAATAHDTVADSKAAFSRLKTLVGEWEADTGMGKVHVSYELIAGGTALVERESSEKMPAMLTVYFVDGGRLLLTHYCVAGNQPRMQAQTFDAATGEMEFQFLDATNLASPDAGHMHNARIRVLDDKHFSAAWQFYENGKPKMTETAQYTRVR